MLFVTQKAPEQKPLDKGDVILCPFRMGNRDNWVSLSPDGIIVLIEKDNTPEIIPETPYVCTVKGMIQKEGRTTAYIVKVDRAANKDDYDHVEDVNWEKGTLKLSARYESRFDWCKFREVEAEPIEEGIPREGSRPAMLRLTLQYGRVKRTREITKMEALRQGLRFNYFVKGETTPKGYQPRITHPNPRFDPAFKASIKDHTGYLLTSTQKLLEETPKVLDTMTLEDLMGIAKRRITQVLATRSYDPIAPDSADEAHLEHVLCGIVRLAVMSYSDQEARRRLVIAEKHIIARHAKHQPTAALLALLNMTGREYAYDDREDRFITDVQNYLAATKGRLSGSWNMVNQDIRGGKIHATRKQAEALLAEHAGHLLYKEDVAVPDTIQSILADLHTHMDARMEMLSEVHSKNTGPVGMQNRLEAYPPCIRHILRRALTDSLSDAEAFTAAAFLDRVGLREERITNALYGIKAARSGHYKTPYSSGKTRNKTFTPPTCGILKELGICHWDCNPAETPVDYFVKHSVPLKRNKDANPKKANKKTVKVVA